MTCIMETTLDHNISLLKATDSYILLMNAIGTVFFWSLPNMSDYMVRSMRTGLSNKPTHAFTLHDEGEIPVAITGSDEITAYGFKSKIVLIHTNHLQLQENSEAILFLDEGVELVDLAIALDQIWVFTEKSIVKYDLPTIINKMDFPTEQLTLKRKMSDFVDRIYELKMHGHAVNSQFQPIFRLSSNGTIFSTADNQLFAQRLGSSDTSNSLFSLKKYSFEIFADSSIQHLLRLDEIITVSSFINTDGWPKYLIGTNHGKIFLVPTTTNATIAQFDYHKA